MDFSFSYLFNLREVCTAQFHQYNSQLKAFKYTQVDYFHIWVPFGLVFGWSMCKLGIENKTKQKKNRFISKIKWTQISFAQKADSILFVVLFSLVRSENGIFQSELSVVVGGRLKTEYEIYCPGHFCRLWFNFISSATPKINETFLFIYAFVQQMIFLQAFFYFFDHWTEGFCARFTLWIQWHYLFIIYLGQRIWKSSVIKNFLSNVCGLLGGLQNVFYAWISWSKLIAQTGLVWTVHPEDRFYF